MSVRGRRVARGGPAGVRPARARRGAALVVALAALVLLMALSLALHAVALRERRSARRATLARAAMDAAEGALARWQAQLGLGEPPEALEGLVDGGATDSGLPGATRVLEGADDGGAGQGAAGIGGVAGARVRVTLVTMGGGVRLLVSDAVADAAGLRARRRVSLLLVADTLAAGPADTAAAEGLGLRLVPAPERAWAELP